jgi:hypothetical protein
MSICNRANLFYSVLDILRTCNTTQSDSDLKKGPMLEGRQLSQLQLMNDMRLEIQLFRHNGWLPDVDGLMISWLIPACNGVKPS